MSTPSDKEHARLQPSSAYRWLVCPGSVELCSQVVDAGSTYADVGTAGHWVFALALGEGRPLASFLGKKAPNDVEITQELLDLVEVCLDWAIKYRDENQAAIFVEKKYEIGAGFGIPSGEFWGTADFTAISKTELCVADLKLGFVDVPVGENEQLISYGLGALDATGWMHDQIRLAILQPRTDLTPKEVVYSAEQMEAFRQKFKPGVEVALKGGALIPTEDGCRFCKAAGVCPALKAETLALAQREFSSVLTMSGEEIADILNKGAMIESALKAVRSHAIKLLEINPEAVPGWKRVAGEKKRVWVSEENAMKELFAAGLEPDEIAPRKLTTPAGAERALAAKMEGEGTKKAKLDAAKKVVSKLAVVPEGNPTLVPVRDERPALESDFADMVKETDAIQLVNDDRPEFLD